MTTTITFAPSGERKAVVSIGTCKRGALDSTIIHTHPSYTSVNQNILHIHTYQQPHVCFEAPQTLKNGPNNKTWGFYKIQHRPVWQRKHKHMIVNILKTWHTSVSTRIGASTMLSAQLGPPVISSAMFQSAANAKSILSFQK